MVLQTIVSKEYSSNSKILSLNLIYLFCLRIQVLEYIGGAPLEIVFYLVSSL